MLSNLKAALAARGMCQADLAAELRIHSSTLSEIVRGRRQADADLRARIASLLGVDEAWLFKSVIPPRAMRVDSPEIVTTG